MPRRTRPTGPALASIVLAMSVAADDLMRPAEAGPSQDSGLPAHVEPVSDLPSDVRELREALDVCLPLSELGDRDHMLSIPDHAAFSHLYVIPCAGGGYNLSSVVYLDSAGEISLQQLETYSPGEGWSAAPDVFNAEWSDGSRTLRAVLKRRSLGDCGSLAEWRYINGELRLERYLDEPECRGATDPQGWPVIYERDASR